MLKPDLVSVQSAHVDFPLFRNHIRRNRDLFGKVIIVWSWHHMKIDVTAWVQEQMQGMDVTFVPHSVVDAHPGRDWYHRAVLSGMDCVAGAHVLVLEQDFIVKNPSLYPRVFHDEHVLVAHQEPPGRGRIDPSFVFMKMDLWNKTSKDVSAGPAGDAWHRVSEELFQLCTPKMLDTNLGLCSPTDWEHLRGLTHNYGLVTSGSKAVYKPERFAAYNREVLASGVPVHPDLLSIVQQSCGE